MMMSRDSLSVLSVSLGVELFFLLALTPVISNAEDSIAPNRSLRDGETIVSRGGIFELGFFSPGSSQKRYLGIWYSKIPVQTVVWVANRATPIDDTSGLLQLRITAAASAVIALHSGPRGSSNAVWSSNSTSPSALLTSPVAQLLDSGNLVLRDESDPPGEYAWQSFDFPTNTLLPGMKLGWDAGSGLNRMLTSWKSADDPAPGELTYGLELNEYPQLAMWRGGSKFFLSGPWIGNGFSSAYELRSNTIFDYTFVSNQQEVYYTYGLKNTSNIISISVLNGTNYSRQRYIWDQAYQAWKVYNSSPRDDCDRYGVCGANGVCVITESPMCRCLKGFKPKSPERWNLMDWSQGCVRNKALECSADGDGFSKFQNVKFPDTKYTWANASMSLKECRAKCLANCSCTAYSNMDFRGRGSGCAVWFGDLMDMRFSRGAQCLNVRLSASEVASEDGPKTERAIIVVVAAVVVGLLITCRYIWKRITTSSEGLEEELELPFFSLATISRATSSFSNDNKIGEGGFGTVYKGILPNRQQIAVKRLSLDSCQGLCELKNEVTLIAKLQHRNLVKLLGCCIEGEEKMLIYEYMPNKSLDLLIFDHTKGKLLEWPKRFQIICGVARGLLYLHQDSRLRIIHRDLKASNVLLDDQMNPKISDFGLAKSFKSDESTAAKTRRVAGTYGYMAPEYAIDGLFSTKSDVFSFGVLLLEIVSGQKNRGFYHPSDDLNLIGHAWRIWNEEEPLELVNVLYEDCHTSEVLRCIHVGLLCVQQDPEDRPNMSSAVLLLVSDSKMPPPKRPGFFIKRNHFKESHPQLSQNNPNSINEISITMLNGR